MTAFNWRCACHPPIEHSLKCMRCPTCGHAPNLVRAGDWWDQHRAGRGKRGSSAAAFVWDWQGEAIELRSYCVDGENPLVFFLTPADLQDKWTKRQTNWLGTVLGVLGPSEPSDVEIPLEVHFDTETVADIRAGCNV
jgi:hypothetical protein